MPIIEDISDNVDSEIFQNKIVVQFYKKKSSKSAIKKMYRSENSMIRPRKIYGSWSHVNTNTQLSSPIFKIGDRIAPELTVALPMEWVFKILAKSYNLTVKFERSGLKRKRNNKLEITKNVTKIIFQQFENYCDKSTLHGLRYVGDTSLSIVERFFWCIAFCSAFGFACYYITNIFEKWNTNPVLVAFNPTDATFNDIPFPAITICNMNQAKREEAEKILREK